MQFRNKFRMVNNVCLCVITGQEKVVDASVTQERR